MARASAASLSKMRHHFGCEQFHAAHYSLMGDSAARIKPADGAVHFEVLSQLRETFDTSLGRVKDSHRLAHLVIGEMARALRNLAYVRGSFFGHRCRFQE